MLEQHIYDLLTTDPDVSDIISGRVYPIVVQPKADLPAVTYMRVSGRWISSLAGTGKTENPRYQVDCYATDYLQCKELSEKVRAAFKGATSFKAVILSDRDLFDDDSEIYRVSIDISCWHTED